MPLPARNDLIDIHTHGSILTSGQFAVENIMIHEAGFPMIQLLHSLLEFTPGSSAERKWKSILKGLPHLHLTSVWWQSERQDMTGAGALTCSFSNGLSKNRQSLPVSWANHL
jgi:hypothetical protein